MDKADRIFKAIADPTRRKIIALLVASSVALPVSAIAEQFPASRQGVTKHLRMLEEAGLLTFQSQGRQRLCQIDLKPMKTVADWIAEYAAFWDDRLDNLQRFLDEEEPSEA